MVLIGQNKPKVAQVDKHDYFVELLIVQQQADFWAEYLVFYLCYAHISAFFLMDGPDPMKS